MKDRYRIKIGWRKFKDSPTIMEYKSSPLYSTKKEAEEALFSFRVDNESNECKKYMMEWSTTTNMQLETIESLQPSKTTSISSPKRLKSYSMPTNTGLHCAHGIQCNNPNPNIIMEQAANVIAINWKKSIDSRTMKRLEKLAHNQETRQYWMDILEKKISMGDWIGLVKGGDDTEITFTLTSFDREHVLMKARHVASAL